MMQEIDLNAFLRDVQSGLDDRALMAGYGITPAELDTLFHSLLEKGLLGQSDLNARFRPLIHAGIRTAPGAALPPQMYDSNSRSSSARGSWFGPYGDWLGGGARIAENGRPAFIAIYLLASALLIWGVCLLMDREMWVSLPPDPPASGLQGGLQSSGRNLSLQETLPPELQMSRAEELLDGLIRGRIPYSELGEYSGIQDDDRCRYCMEECEHASPGTEQEECRRECLYNCSPAARLLMNR